MPFTEGIYYPEYDLTYIECLHETNALNAALNMTRMTGRPSVVILSCLQTIATSITALYHIPVVTSLY
jgi:thiamine pyrophosphate-dependent acetolactate synthase large subunit-like protein